MKLIALCGAAGAGKDTVADMLPVRKLAFADALYREVAEAWGVEQHVLRCQKTKETPTNDLCVMDCEDEGFTDFVFDEMWSVPRSPRRILQWWGDYRRAQMPDYFVAKMATELSITHEPVVITDVRFPNEAAMVRQLGGQIWQIHRPSYEAGGTGHASDTDGSAFSPDRVVVNSGSLEDLRAAVLAAWEGKADAREALGSLIKERKK